MTESKISVREQVDMGFVVFLPFIALLVGMMPFWSFSPDGISIALFLTNYYHATLGVTIGYHRYVTHSAFVACYLWVKWFLVLSGIISGQGGPIMWGAWHITHHAHADEEGDPHSPHLHEPGLWGTIKGAVHAHTWWLFVTPRVEADDPVAKRLRKDVDLVLLEKYSIKIFLVWLIVQPALVGALLRQSFDEVPQDILWGGFIRLFFTNHATWSVNSICHLWGSRPFNTPDMSRNNWLVVLLASGEGWHNNHHAFQRSAKQGLLPNQFDLSYLVIRGMEKLGWIKEVYIPSEEQIEAKLASAHI